MKDKYRFLNIIGPTGMGKTALAKEICHYVFDRRLFKDGVIYLDLKDQCSILDSWSELG